METMPKCKLSTLRIEEKAAFEVESEDEDFEDNEDIYEPMTKKIDAADTENCDSDSGENIEYLLQELRERAALDRSILYESKDAKITFSTEAATLHMCYNEKLCRSEKMQLNYC